MAIEIPALDPVALQVGPIVVRWYALSYMAGFLLGWKYCLSLISKRNETDRPNAQDIDDFIVWSVLGVILGGRVGYVLFYQFSLYASEPLEIFKLWHGGMSFHGGMIGMIIALGLFSWRRKISLLRLSDVVCASVPIGLFFGRIANFINGELMGRPTNMPWGVIFMNGGDSVARHPSPLYEAFLEGVVLFFVLMVLMRLRLKPGIVASAFMIGYGVFRGLVEFVRQPDSQIGLIGGFITMGQILCIPMIVIGVAVIFYAFRKNNRANGATVHAE